MVTPQRLPLPQKLMLNPAAITSDSDIPMNVLASGLTDAQDFNIAYHDLNANTTVGAISQCVYDFGVTESSEPPYMYGSYTVYRADS